MIKIWWFIKCFAGFGSVEDGSICWFDSVTKVLCSHDYPEDKGGDGFPDCWKEYTCHKCGKKFGI